MNKDTRHMTTVIHHKVSSELEKGKTIFPVRAIEV
jgi:hypothetical protein